MRGSIVDVFGSTAEVPVRIDLWGDEVDRLTEFSVSDQRSTVDIAEVELFGCRELLPDRRGAGPGRGPHRHRSVGSRPVGAPGPGAHLRRHGVVAALADRRRAGAVRPGRTRRPRCCWSSLAGCATGPPTSWPRRPTWPPPWPSPGGCPEPGERRRPTPPPASRSSTCRSTGSWSHTTAPTWTVTTAPEGPDVATVTANGWAPVVGDGGGLVASAATTCCRAATGWWWPPTEPAPPLGSPRCSPNRALSARTWWPRPSSGASSCPAVKLAVLAESDVTGRRRAHRRARPRRREAQGFFDDLKPGDYVVHYQHGVARYGGMVTRAIGGVERDYLLLEYRGDDRLYVPSDQIDAVRHYTGGESPSLSRMGGGDWQKAKARVRSAVAEIAQELVVLYQTRVHTPGHAFGPDTPWQHELEEAFPYELRPTSARPSPRSRRTWRRRRPWTAWCAATSGSARPRWPSGPCSRPSRTACRRPSWCPPPAGPAALPDLRRALRPVPGAGGGAQPLPHPGPGPRP